MIELRFVVDEDLLLAHILESYSSHAPFVRLKKQIWERNPSFYYLASQKSDPLIMESGISAGIAKAMAARKQILSFAKHSKEFKRTLAETKKYAVAIKKEWDDLYPVSIGQMDAITNLNISAMDMAFTVYILHPLLQCGRSYIDQHAITWSHPPEWKDYAVIYLWHEVMHHITYRQSRAPHLMHSIIELCCDNELRVRLHGKGEYFKENGLGVGHRYLMHLNKILLPDWENYLKNKKENIYQFEKRMMVRHRKEALAKAMPPIAQWAEWH